MMSTKTKVKFRLHYWDVRGRAQALRYMLEDIAYQHKNVDYKEDFELVETMMTKWPQVKSNQDISGPYRSLPVLHWNDTDVFGQTLTIAHVIARKFNLYGKMTSKYNDPILLEGYINGVVIGAYTDIIEKILTSLWSKPDMNKKNTFEYYSIRQAQDGLVSLNTILKQSSTSFFYDQIEPTVADYFAFEAYTVVRDVQEKLLPNNSDALAKHEQIMKERPALANYFKQGLLYKRFTAAPDEGEYLAKLAGMT